MASRGQQQASSPLRAAAADAELKLAAAIEAAGEKKAAAEEKEALEKDLMAEVQADLSQQVRALDETEWMFRFQFTVPYQHY